MFDLQPTGRSIQVSARAAYRRPFPRQLLAVTLLAALPTSGWAARVDGFTEPYRSVEVATTEVGIIKHIAIEEGETVAEGDILATLDDDVQNALLAIAAKNVQLRGRYEAVIAELELRQKRLEKLESLHDNGHARQEEVERARADLAIAEAQVLAAEEELTVRQLEYNKTAIQVERRKVLAPMAGVVSVVLKEPGEFVAPTDPHILKLVQLDKLLATFSVQSKWTEEFEIGTKVKIALNGAVIEGSIERIAPVTDAESGTVRVKIGVDNSEGKFRSGQRCSLLLPE